MPKKILCGQGFTKIKDPCKIQYYIKSKAKYMHIIELISHQTSKLFNCYENEIKFQNERGENVVSYSLNIESEDYELKSAFSVK